MKYLYAWPFTLPVREGILCPCRRFFYLFAAFFSVFEVVAMTMQNSEGLCVRFILIENHLLRLSSFRILTYNICLRLVSVRCRHSSCSFTSPSALFFFFSFHHSFHPSRLPASLHSHFQLPFNQHFKGGFAGDSPVIAESVDANQKNRRNGICINRWLGSGSYIRSPRRSLSSSCRF